MRAKRSIASAQWILDPDHASTATKTVPVGAVLATEPLFLELAHEAQVSSIARAARALARTLGE